MLPARGESDPVPRRLRPVPRRARRRRQERGRARFRRQRARLRHPDPRAYRSFRTVAAPRGTRFPGPRVRDAADRGPARRDASGQRPHSGARCRVGARARGTGPTRQARARRREERGRAAVHGRRRGALSAAAAIGRLRDVDGARARHPLSLSRRGAHPGLCHRRGVGRSTGGNAEDRLLGRSRSAGASGAARSDVDTGRGHPRGRVHLRRSPAQDAREHLRRNFARACRDVAARQRRHSRLCRGPHPGNPARARRPRAPGAVAGPHDLRRFAAGHARDRDHRALCRHAGPRDPAISSNGRCSIAIASGCCSPKPHRSRWRSTP